jgi:proliferating cell nuclear antigen
MGKKVYLKTPHVQALKTLIEVLATILVDITIEFTGNKVKISSSEEKGKKSKKHSQESKNTQFNGLKILATSSEKTVLICLKLYASEFTEFACKNKPDNRYLIGVNIISLYKLMKTIDNKEDTLELYIDNDDIQSLVLSVSYSKMGRKSDSKLRLIEYEPVSITPPPVEADVMITMSATEFHKICKDMIQIGSEVEIKCTMSTLIFTCVGDNMSIDKRYTISEDGIKIVFTNQNKNLIIQGMYKLREINMFSKCASLSTHVQLMMKVNKYPLIIQYTVATLGDFIACISPIEPKIMDSTYKENEELYASDEEIELKDDFANE